MRVRYLQEDVLKFKKIDFVTNEAVIVDYYVAALWWAAKEQKFTKEQIAAFYTVMHSLLNDVRGTRQLAAFDVAMCCTKLLPTTWEILLFSLFVFS